jgi:plasmid stabilization system protein ParE
MYKLNFTKTFKKDVISSVEYIKHTLQAPAAAERLKKEIKNTYKKIKEMPFIYPIVPNNYLAALGFRFVMVKNYMLFYTIEEQQINIIRFLYGRRDWITILQDTNLPD